MEPTLRSDFYKRCSVCTLRAADGYGGPGSDVEPLGMVGSRRLNERYFEEVVQNNEIALGSFFEQRENDGDGSVSSSMLVPEL